MKYFWLESDAADLGKLTDKALAARIGISMQTVRRERIRRGIQAFKPHPEVIPWCEEDLALLGTMTDEALARRTGRQTTAVQQKRLSLNIPPVKKRPLVKWTAEELALLGSISDRELARRKGVSIPIVFRKRQELGIAPLPVQLRESRSAWSESDIAMFGTMTDAEVSRRTGRPLKSVKQERLRRGIAAFTVPKLSMDLIPARSGLTVSWGALKELEQHRFYEVLVHEYQERTGRQLTLEKVSKITYLDLQSLRNWFAAPDSFFVLPLTARHHIWLAIAFTI